MLASVPTRIGAPTMVIVTAIHEFPFPTTTKAIDKNAPQGKHKQPTFAC